MLPIKHAGKSLCQAMAIMALLGSPVAFSQEKPADGKTPPPAVSPAPKPVPAPTPAPEQGGGEQEHSHGGHGHSHD